MSIAIHGWRVLPYGSAVPALSAFSRACLPVLTGSPHTPPPPHNLTTNPAHIVFLPQVKCERAIPCARCCLLGLPCRPRERRPSGRKAGAKPLAGVDEGDEEVEEGVEGSSLAKPVMDVVMATPDIKANAERYLQAFFQVRTWGGGAPFVSRGLTPAVFSVVARLTYRRSNIFSTPHTLYLNPDNPIAARRRPPHSRPHRGLNVS